jgi:hypothetical protein
MDTKIPFYNLLNMFLIGLIFTGCCIVLFNEQVLCFIKSDIFKSIKEINVGFETVITISFFAVIYEIGFIINRIGSLIESLLKKCPVLLPFDNDYKKFSERKKEFPIMTTLSREYALSRTSISLFFLMTVISCFCYNWVFVAIMFLLTILFYFSMRKHASKIVELMKN